MPKNMLKASVLILLASLLILAGALLFTDWRFPRQSNGQLVFANTYIDGTELDKIVVTSPEGTVTLQHENGYWVVKEADYYYADIDLLNRLLTDFNNATYYSEQPFSEAAAAAARVNRDGTLIQTYQNNRLLDSIIIGKSAENRQYHFARPTGRKEIWLIDGQYALPPEFYSWIMQPVSELPPELVESVETGGITAARNNFRQSFSGADGFPIAAQPLLQAAAYITAEQVSAAQNFDESLYPKRRTLRFTTFQGLVVEYRLYSDGRSYWLGIALSATPLPKQAVNAYIRDNHMFYDGWYFRIPSVQGKLLFSLPLK